MTLPDRQILSRAAALAILVAVAGAIWIGPVAAYLDELRAGARDIAAKEQLLQRYDVLIQRRAPVPAAAAAQRILFPELSDAQGLAMLQEAVKGLAARSRVEIQGLQILQSDSQSGLSRIGIRVRATADIDGTNGLLYAIEAARPLLYVDNLQIRPQMANNAVSPVLDLQFDVSAFKPGAPT